MQSAISVHIDTSVDINKIGSMFNISASSQDGYIEMKTIKEFFKMLFIAEQLGGREYFYIFGRKLERI